MSSVAQRLARILRARFAAARDRGFASRRPPPPPPAGDEADPGPTVDPELAGYYANLELPYGADLEAVRRARKRLMRKYHPDLHGADPQRQRVATELVKGLNLAYEGLRGHLEKNA